MMTLPTVLLHSALAPATLLDALRRSIDSEQRTLFSLSGYKGDRPVLGEVRENAFRLQKRRYSRNDFAGQFYGTVVSEAGGSRIGRMTVDGTVNEFLLPRPDSQPRAMAVHPDGGIWFVETGANALGRLDRDGTIVEFAVPTPNASVRGVAVSTDGDIWFTENSANKIGRMTANGTMIDEYLIPTASSGARCITAMSDGRLFFTQYDAGMIGEILPR